MSTDDAASQSTLNSTLYVSTIDISLASDSKKEIRSIQLKKNDQLLKDVQKVIRAGSTHTEDFSSLLVLKSEDHIHVVVSCSWWMRSANIPISISLRDVQCMRDEEGTRSYRKKERSVKVVLAGRLPLLATTTPIIQSCSQFRLLIIGNSGVGKSSLIQKVFGVESVFTSTNTRGVADIDQEFVSPTNNRFVVHDSLGFEAGDERNINIVKEFVSRRKAMTKLKDQLHAVWLCLDIPYAGGRLLEAGAEKFLQRRDEILGDIPLVVVLTKVDLLDWKLKLDIPANETLEDRKSKYLAKYCMKPLHEAGGEDITHVIVSIKDGYSKSLSDLFKATEKNMAKHHVDEASRFAASSAQRISIKEKIELSIFVGKKKYWNMLLKSAVFRGHTLRECLQVIRKDVIAVWNFNDPDNCLMDDKIIENLLRVDNLGDADGVPPNLASFASLLASGLELAKGLATSGDITMSVIGPVASIALSLLETVYTAYQEAKKDVKILMAYTVDLICVMQAIFLLASGRRVTPETVALALKAYEGPRRFVHLMVDGFDGTLGVIPGGRDRVLDKVEELIWRFSIADYQIEELRQPEPSGSS